MRTSSAGTAARKQLGRARPPRRALAVVLMPVIVLVLTVLGAPAALAHTELTGTSPVDGQVLPQAPGAVRLSFNEPVGASGESIRMLTPSGEPVPLDVQAVDSTVTITPAAPLGHGTHTVAWRVTSADGHPISGSSTFSVGSPTAATAEPTESAPPLQAMIGAQTLTYLGVFAAAGLVVFELLFLTAGPAAAPGIRRRLHRLAYLAAATTTVGAALSVLTAIQGQPAAVPGPLAGPVVAAALTTTGVLLAVLAASRATDGRLSALYRTAALTGAAVAALSLVLTGHTRSAEPGWLVIPADAVHVAAGSTWVGGILGLLVVLGRTAETPARHAAATLARFSTAAAWAVLAVAVTGTVLGWRIVGDLQALVTTGYGQMLLAKLTVVLLVVLVAAWNRFVLLPRVLTGEDSTATGSLRSAIRGEAAVLGLVLVLTGILSFLGT